MVARSRDVDIRRICLRELEVLEVFDHTPAMIRVIVGGPGMGACMTQGVEQLPMASYGFDDDVRIILPDPATGEQHLPSVKENGKLDWDPISLGLSRTYTIRAIDEQAGTMTLDFVRHEGGLAAEWAAATQAGDKIWVAGPPAHASMPTHTDWLLLAGDETALPAIERCLEELPEGHPTIVCLEVAEREHVPADLRSTEDVQVYTAIRSQGQSLPTLVHSLQFPEGEGFVWAGGEAMKLKPMRRLFNERGVDRKNQDITGYWRADTGVSRVAEAKKAREKKTQAQVQQQRPAAGDPRMAALYALEKATSIAPAMVVRTALDLDLCGMIYQGMDTAEAMAAHLAEEGRAVPAHNLDRILRALVPLQVVTWDKESSTWQLGILGTDFADPGSMVAHHLESTEAMAEFALFNLPQALTGDTSRTIPMLGDSWPKLLTGESHKADAVADLEEALAHDAMRGAAAFPQAVDLKPHLVGENPSLKVVGAGAEEWVRHLERHYPGVHLSASLWPDEEAADVIIAVDPWALHGPEQVVQMLSELRCTKLFVLTPAQFISDTGEASAEVIAEDLRRMCTTGGYVPTQEEALAEVHRAGWELMGTPIPCGWVGVVVPLKRRG